MLFLEIISWKSASPFNGGGGGCFSDGEASFLSTGCASWGRGIGFDRRVEKNRRMGNPEY